MSQGGTGVGLKDGDAVEVFINGKLLEKVYAGKADYQSDCHKRAMHLFGADEFLLQTARFRRASKWT